MVVFILKYDLLKIGRFNGEYRCNSHRVDKLANQLNPTQSTIQPQNDKQILPKLLIRST